MIHATDLCTEQSFSSVSSFRLSPRKVQMTGDNLCYKKNMKPTRLDTDDKLTTSMRSSFCEPLGSDQGKVHMCDENQSYS